MAARKPKTEERAKGLIGLKKGKKVAGAAYSVGNYKGKTLNLTKKQLGKKGTAAAKKRTVNISNTKYDATAKKVMGPAGKPLTGKVDLGGGNMAVYRNGVRVRAAKKVVSSRSVSGSRGTKSSPYSATKKKTYSNNTVGANVRERTPSKVGTPPAKTRTVAQSNTMGAEGPKGLLKPGPKPKVSPYGRNKARLNPHLKYSRRIEKALAKYKNVTYGR